jgi:carbonic anhydrase
MKRLVDGYVRFRAEVFPENQELFRELAHKQNPQALFITCSDSRVLPDLLTQSEPGDLFSCRNAGNIVPPYGSVLGGVSATIEYAVMVLNVEHIIVCGHYDCGAMKGALQPETLTDIPTVSSWLRHSDAAREVVKAQLAEADFKTQLDALVEENVLLQLAHLRTHPSVASRLAKGEIDVHGWVYRIHTGEIRAFDADLQHFVALDSPTLPIATPRQRSKRAIS